MIEQVRFAELLQDDLYRKWLAKVPRTPDLLPGGKILEHRWRVWAQRKEGGPWGRKDFRTYSEGYKFLVKHVREWNDAALGCRDQEFLPILTGYRVVVTAKRKERLPQYHLPCMPRLDHHWCGFCRRPTLFRPFTRHHAFAGTKFNTSEFLDTWDRCSICGIRLEGLTRR